MALDRVCINGLVDDDGSGTTGTPWNKAAVLALINAIDLRVRDWVDVPYNAANFTGNGSTWTVEAGDVAKNRYCRIGNVLIWTVAIAASSLSGTGNPLVVLNGPIPGTTFPDTFNFALCVLPGPGVRVYPGAAGATYLVADYVTGNWPASTNGMYLYFTWIGEVI